MNRPLIITDCDEVLLHMVVPFRDWLDETHNVHFDMHDRGFAEALRHKDSGQVVERELVWGLLVAFFDTEM
ncbi:MAG: HAD family hydrolase, partial [Alphaproteobacteria bacterium]|nr:HAD family hydrolase [Alphaproteobacteria bacterium]